MKSFLLIVLLFVGKNSFSQTFYQCFDSDKNSSLKISVKYTNGKAISVKYLGQSTEIPITFVKDRYQEGGAHPTTYSIYKEKMNKKVTGIYTITHSGAWDYLEYVREKDKKVFNFSINHSISIINDEYRTTPCF